MIDSASTPAEREIEALRARVAQLEAIDAERRRIEHDLARGIEFERLLSAVSQGFLRSGAEAGAEAHAQQIDLALERLAAFAGSRRALACALAAGGGSLRTIRRWPPAEDATAGEAELLAAAAQDGSRAAIERWEVVRAGPTRSLQALLIAPMIADGALFGALVFEGSRRVEAFSEREATLAGMVAGILASVIARERMEAEIRRLNRDLEESVHTRTAALQASLAELESFSYSVSHDLRSPLRAINGYAHLLQEDYGGRLDDTARGYLGRICAATERMGSLIDDLLNLSRISRSRTEPTEVDLSGIATEVLRECAAAEPQRRVEARIEPCLRARGDASLLRVALENLLGNAWKFSSRAEQASIEVGIVESAQGPAFYVRDNGEGFDPAYAAKLFQPFQRLHEIDDFPGTGIGLATVKRIIDRHGGTIWASSEPGRGATFYFTLPAPGNGR